MHTPGHGAYIFVIDGGITVGSQQLGRRDALGVSDAESIELTATKTSDVLVFEVPMTM
jgi:redox-sensitive bicupin YhaK (pirin superfamily)